MTQTTAQIKDRFIDEAARLALVTRAAPLSDAKAIEAVVTSTGYPRQINPNSVFGRLITMAYSAAGALAADQDAPDDYTIELAIRQTKRSPYYVF